MDEYESANDEYAKEIQENKFASGNGSEDDEEDAEQHELTELEEMRKSLLEQLQQEEDEDEDESKDDWMEMEQSENKTLSSDSDDEQPIDSDYDEADEEEEEEEEFEEQSKSPSINSNCGDRPSREAMVSARSEEIDSMLEEQIDAEEEKSNHISKKFKRVLEHRGMDHFDVLPDGWVEITHSSGLPVYLHKPSRCCTFARPYFIGRGSVRNHKVPESAIPCLFQKKVRDEAKKAEEKNNKCPETGQESNLLSRLGAPCVKVKTEEDMKKAQLSPEQLFEYAKRCFSFKNICVYRFRKWSEKRSFQKKKKARRALNQTFPGASGEARPSLPSSVKLITVPALEIDSKPHQRTFYLNPQGKTSVSILHEFVQKVLKCTVRYFFSETRSCATPFHCVAKLVSSNTHQSAETSSNGDQMTRDLILQKLALIRRQNQQVKKEEEEEDRMDDFNRSELKTGESNELITLGDGLGAGKKSAKLMAARNSLQKLVPGIDFDEEGIAVTAGMNQSTLSMKNEPADEVSVDDPFHFFDLLDITDTRIPELSARAGQLSPYLILQEYLKCCSPYGDTAIQMTTRRLRHQRHEFTLTIGDNEKVRVVSTNKREGKQKAAQAMLKKLHPNNSSWGTLLRQYGYEAQQKFKEARKNKDSVTKLQGIPDEESHEKSAKGDFQPNAIILEKLRSEMLKLSEGLIAHRCNKDAVQLNDDQLFEQLLQNGDDVEEPNMKLRRTDFHSELPILSEEQLCRLSAKLGVKRKTTAEDTSFFH